MERKQKIEIIIAILILLGLAVLLWWYLARPVVEEQRQEEERLEQLDENGDGAVDTIDTSDLPDQPETIARVFVERFGSFSSESGYENIDDILVLATSALQGRLQTIADQARAQGSEAYYGVSTAVLTIEEVAASNTSMSYVITTQREESIDSPGNTSIRYQEIEVTLSASGDTWLVSSFTWGESL